METTNKGTKVVVVSIIIGVVVVLAIAGVITLGCLGVFKTENVNITKTEKEVTVTDEGIADAVDKIYDAVVIVEVGSSKDSINGWGSGVVYDKDDKYAYILTNHHVVDDGKYVLVEYTDESQVEAEIVGSDEIQDIAVLKVPVDSILAVAEVGSSNDLDLGDTVFTVGTPVGLSYKFTVTRGILSGKDRLCQMSSSNSSYYGYLTQANTWYMSLLQIDATINSGNSGGPLANSNGQIVGITNSKLSSSYSTVSIENMGFAIPIEDAMNVASQIRKDGKVTRPFFGVSVSDLSNASRLELNVDSSLKQGAMITSVENDSTAADAGLKKGDVILKIGDDVVKNYKYFRYYLYRHSVGEKVTITYNREGKAKTVDVTLKS